MKLISTILFVACASVHCFGQSLSDLNKEKDDILSLIDESNKLLNDYSNKKSSELMHISLVDDKIAKRKRLINIYNNQIFAYTSQIKTLTIQLDSLENEIFRLKEDYSKMIYQLSINKMDRNGLIYVLSSASFNESYRRFLFMKQYNDYRKQQSELITDRINFFNNLKAKVTAQRTQLDKTLAETKKESMILEKELLERQNKVSRFSAQQNNLTNQITEAEKRKAQLEEQIVAMIREEARKKRESNAINLSSDIAKNKGLLPWPCNKYVVVSTFGEHDHPIIPSIKVRNNGIDIDVLDNNDVKPIHAGRVSRVIMIPGSNASVIIRHDNIITVYSNLSEVFVKKDDEVTAKTLIGKVYTGEGLNSNILHFELWNAEEKQNPLDWLEKF